jgi:hypothetical protein
MTRALVCSALVSSCVALGQGISTKQAYLPSDLAVQIEADLRVGDGCPPVGDSILTTWLRLSKARPLAVRVDGCGICLSGVTNGSILLYARGRHTWRKVLDAQGVRMFSLPGRTQGWRGLDLLQHVNAFISTHLIYRFDGLEYKPAECVEVDNTTGGPPRPKRQPCSFDWKASVDR